ncbi:hypothetical protein Tco_0707220 [Tanacetum coccineum]|uniref:Uncharacterized protein n=1 Tax=Tanacetum coccineum TaxID=301880 RepID=A0ABQ4Y9N1_9ASTR
MPSAATAAIISTVAKLMIMALEEYGYKNRRGIRCTYAIHQLTYDTVPDALDEYQQIGEKTFCDALQALYKAIMDLYGDEFLRRLTYTDVEKLYIFHEEKHGFPACLLLGSVRAVGVLDSE